MPAVVAPTLTSIAFLCLIDNNSPILRVFGSGYNGLGFLDFSLDWAVVGSTGGLFTRKQPVHARDSWRHVHLNCVYCSFLGLHELFHWFRLRDVDRHAHHIPRRRLELPILRFARVGSAIRPFLQCKSTLVVACQVRVYELNSTLYASLSTSLPSSMLI